VIKSFNCKHTAKLFDRQAYKKLPQNILRAARRKLLMLDAATKVEDLTIPPGNRLERLKGRRTGQYSIRINDQWRICFNWKEGNAYDAEICDYH